MARSHLLESLSSLECILELLEKRFSVLDLKDKYAPESLEKAFSENEFEAKLSDSLPEHCNHEPLSFLKWSIKCFP